MKYTNLVGGLLVGQAVFGAVAVGQEATQQRDTVEVSSLRLDQSANEAGTAVTIIGAETIERRGLMFVGDAVASAPGVTVSQAGAFGGVSYVRMRGNAPGQTLVLVDGVPVNDVASPGGGYDFGTLDAFGVERIEVLRGPQSTLWGSDAIGGVISVVTEKPEAGLGWAGFTEVGSFTTARGGLKLAGAGDRADGGLSAVYAFSDGISKADEADGNTEDDGYASLDVRGRAGYDLTSHLRANFNARWQRSEFDFDGFPPPNFVLADSDDRSQNEELSVSGRLAADHFGGRLNSELMVSRAEIERENFSAGASTSLNKGERTDYRYAGRLDVAEGHIAMFGLEREESEADGLEAQTDSLFALYEWAPVESVTLTGGVRHDEDDRYGSETTGRAAASWHVAEAVRLRATWGQGFKAPTIFQSTYICGFCGLTSPNADLKAETSEAFDVGVDLNVGPGVLALTAFDQSTENLIDFSFMQGYANIAQADQRGLEVDYTTPVGRWLALRTVYTYIDAKDGTGAPLPRVPEHSGNVELYLAGDGPVSGSLAVRYNGGQSDGFGPEVPAWTRLDLAAGYAFSSGLELYGRVENLLEEDYQQVGGYGTPGISGYLGVRVRN